MNFRKCQDAIDRHRTGSTAVTVAKRSARR